MSKYILRKFEPSSINPVDATGVNESASELNLKIITSAIAEVKSKFHKFKSLPSIFICIRIALAIMPKQKKSFTSIKRTLRI